VVGAYRTIRHELETYGHGLSEKPEILCLSKVDALDEEALAARRAELEWASGRPVHAISAVAQRGLGPVLDAAWKLVLERRRERTAETA
jgi:GTP-binding protein